MILKQNINNYVFTRNPVILEMEGHTGIAEVRIFNINTNELFYRGKFSLPFSVDLSDILETVADPLPATGKIWSGALRLLGTLNPSIAVTISPSTTEGSNVVTPRMYFVLPFSGGVSRQFLREHGGVALADPFVARFLKTEGNFFLTTRTDGELITLKETELGMLTFINKETRNLRITSPGCPGTVNYYNIPAGIYGLDIAELREQFVREYGILSNVFDVVNGPRILIERAEVALERYVLSFRNSLGTFDNFEVVGNLTVNPQFANNEEVNFNRYDYEVGDFVTDRNRMACSRSLSIDTGVKRPEEVRLLFDLVASEEVYIRGLRSEGIRVIPTINEPAYKFRATAPENFTLDLLMIDSEENLLSNLEVDTLSHRTFSKQFSKQFS